MANTPKIKDKYVSFRSVVFGGDKMLLTNRLKTQHNVAHRLGDFDL